MNQKFSAKAIQRGLWTGALLLGAALASAQTTVTVQVDMTVATTNGTFNPAAQTVDVRGSFNGWSTLVPLTNNMNAANTNLYSGTVSDTSDGNGTGMDWQYVVATGGNINTYSSQNDNDNYCVALPGTSGGSIITPVEFWDDNDGGVTVTNSITFQVDMAEQLHLGNFATNDSVYCQGQFEGWNDNFPLTNNPALNVTNGNGAVTSLVYQGTYTTWSATPNALNEYKFVYHDTTDHYEGVSTANADPNTGNRFFTNQTQVLPLASYGDVPFSDTVTNNVTFVIDMSIQEFVHNFTSNNTVEIHGDYNGWGGGTTMTNTNSANTNLYYTTLQYVAGAGSQRYFKYVIQPGTQWENVSAANAIGGNRWLNLASTSTSFSNGPVYFSDQGPNSLLDFVTVTNEMVTFTVNMTNATGTGPGGTQTFDNTYPSSDSVWLNGVNNGVNNSFWTWGQAPVPGGQPGYQMTQISNTMLFTITLPVNIGQNGDLVYKYSINGYDDEAASGVNHVRWMRSQPNYTMPLDTYGSQPGEISWGNLAITNLGNSQIEVSWLGRGGVHLQTASSLNPGAVWTNLYQTDGTNLLVALGGEASTNFNVGPGNLFYRLTGPQ